MVGAAMMALMTWSSGSCAQRRPGNRVASSDSPRVLVNGGKDSAAARVFVQSFYDWYAPIANAESRVPASWRALTSRPESLDGKLMRALRADSAAQSEGAAATRDVINFDPFLASQDPCPRYEALQARLENGEYLVPVKPICLDSAWQAQRPLVAVSRASSEWKIVNVYYEKRDLMGLLCQYAKADRRPEPLVPGC